MKTAIFFDPCVGKNYGSELSIFKQKLLIVGNSHYCGKCPDCGDRDICGCGPTLTQKAVSVYLDPKDKSKWKKTYSTFINSFFGKPTSLLERQAFFDSVAFYNFLQVSAGEDPYSTSQYDFKEKRHLDAFYEVLDSIMPDVVVCWGDTVWDILPNNWNAFGEAERGVGIQIGDTVFKNYLIYPYKDKKITLVGVKHPSQGYGSDFHHKVLSSFGSLV